MLAWRRRCLPKSTTPATAAATSATCSSSRRRSSNKNSFLYALPGVDSIRDPKLNIQQTYSVTRETYRNGKRDRSHGARHRPPGGAEQRRAEDDPELRRGRRRRRSARLDGGGKVFVGQRDDPFFVDLGTTFDAINIRNGTGNAGGGKDDLAGYNVHSIVLQVPEAEVTRDRQGRRGAEGARTPWSACGRRTERAPCPRLPGSAEHDDRTRRKGQDEVGPGQPPGQPARQRGRHPARARRTTSTRRSRPTTLKNFGKYVALAAAREGHQRAVPGPQRAGDEPHRHRPGAADRASPA